MSTVATIHSILSPRITSWISNLKPSKILTSSSTATALITSIARGGASPAPSPSSIIYEAAAAATAAATSTTPRAKFLQLALAFMSGGLFFSSVLAIAGSIAAIGLNNTRRLLLVLFTVTGVVLNELKLMMNAAIGVLFGNWSAYSAQQASSENRWKETYSILKKGWSSTRQKASVGVSAIRAEANMYAAVVGMPALVPLQYALDRMILTTLAGPLEQSLIDSLADFSRKSQRRNSGSSWWRRGKKKNLKEGEDDDDASFAPPVSRLKLKRFSIGTNSPRLLEARMYDIGPNDLAFDIDVRWESNLSFDIDMMLLSSTSSRIPLSIKNLSFEGPMRLIIAGLRRDPPGFGAMLLSLPSPPKKIGLDVKVAGGEVTRAFPWLRGEVTKMMQEAISKEVLWPNRLVVPALGLPKPSSSASSASSSLAMGSILQPILSMKELEKLKVDDPLLRAEKKSDEKGSQMLPPRVSHDEKDMSLEINMKDNNNNRNVTNGVNITNLEEETNSIKEKVVGGHKSNNRNKNPFWAKLGKK